MRHNVETMRALAAVGSVWAVLFVVPFVIYGAASSVIDLKPPVGPAWQFLVSVAVTKLGTAAAFVALFAAGLERWRRDWLRYAAIWFVMFAVSEIGDSIKPSYSFAEAALGILSEAVYAPLAAFATARLLR